MPDSTLENLTEIQAAALSDSDITYVVRPSTDADYKSSLGNLKTYAATRKPQIVATHTAIPAGVYAASTGGRTDVQQQIRQGHLIGPSDVSQLQLGMVGFYSPTNSNTGDMGLGNDFTWEAGIELTSPVMTRNAFVGASKVTTILNNSPLVLTNPLVEGVAAGSTIYTRQSIVIPDYATGKFFGISRALYNASNVLSPAAASQVSATGALTTPSGGVTTFARMSPAVVLGIPKDPMPSVLVIGDSISAGTGDASADARGMLGYITRGLDNVTNGCPLPWHSQTISGWMLEGQRLDLAPGQRDIWPYCTHVLFALGINDIFSYTLSDMQTKATKVFAELKRVIGPYGKPLHVTAVLITPQTTSSNSWVDAAGQTLHAKWVSGGQRDQYNAWLQSQVGANIDQVLDLSPATEDPASPGKWYTSGTANFPTNDGIHPRTGMVSRMQVLVNNWAKTLKP